MHLSYRMEDFIAPNDPIGRARVRELSERSDAKGFRHLAARPKQPFVRDSEVAGCVAEARWMWAG